MKNKIIMLSITVMLGIGALGTNNTFATTVTTATPHIFYSDLTAGPKTGGQNSNGVFVTIWGNNFGSTQGTSTITVGGGAVASYLTWTNTEICFQLGANALTGNIVLTTSGGTATGPLFTVQSGNIYFVQPGASINGTGTYTSPFNHIYYFNSIAKPGDTVYVEAGTIYDEVDGIDGWHSMLEPISNGNQGSPISYIAYPNATVILESDGNTATWTDGNSGGDDNVSYIFRQGAANDSDWQTISKFTVIQTTSNTTSAVSSSGANGWKIVGNNITAQSNPNNGMINVGGNYTQVLGNEIHNIVLSPSNNEAHSIYWNGGGSNVEIGWNYMHDNNGVGWEIQAYHAGTRNGKIHDNLIINTAGNIARGINIGDVDGGEDRTGPENSVYDIYNNIIVGAGDGVFYGALALTDGTAYVYNNTFYKNNGSTDGVIGITAGGYGPNGGNPVWYFADNIIVSTSGIPYMTDGNGNPPPAYFSLITNNLYYGNGNGPSIDGKPINGNPEFVNAAISDTADFHLQSTSAAINAGYNTSSIVPTDYDGNLMPLSGSVSIGAYQYGSSSLLPSLPVVAITSPSNGSSVASGSNITITATASETNGSISSVSFYNGSTLLGSDSTSPYTYVMSSPAAGTYNLTAVATDPNGVSVTSSAVTVTISTQSVLPSTPVVTITNPASGSTYTAGSNVTITTTASETNGTISSIALYNGSGVLLGSSTTSPFNYAYNNILAGNYSFYAIAMDANGVSTTSSTITAIATAASSSPVVAITNPINNATFTAGSSISITAAASETNGSIAKISLYYNGTNSLGSGSTSPYSHTANNVPAGTYTLTAVATDANGVSTTSSPITITFTSSSNVAPSITTQPVGATVTAPIPATFIVAATGTPAPTFQWMQSVSGGAFTNISGATSSSYTTATTTTANSGTQFECVITNTSGSVTSSAASLTVNPTPAAPNITAQPTSMMVTAPATATFSVAATGTPAPTFQWMQSINGGVFTNISGATNSSYTTAATTTANNGTQYEVVVTNASGSVTSSAATLTVNPTPVAPSITMQPIAATVTAPATAMFSVAATGTPAPTFQWMQSVNEGAFTNISGATSSSYMTAATTTANSGTQFECVVTNASGSVTSNAVSLTVNPTPVAPSITMQPIAATVTAPAIATFSVAATGTPAPTFQWMQSVNGGAFTNISGATNSSYTTAATTTANNNTQFKCVVTNASGSVTSNAATLTVSAPAAPVVSITTPASGNNLTAGTMTITANAFVPNGTISNVSFYNGSTLIGSTSTDPENSFSIIANLPAGTYTLTAIATGSNGVSTTSSPVTVTIAAAPVLPSITAQPISVAVTAPSSATFSVSATGTPAPTFQWMQSVNGGSFTAISGATSSSYTTAATTVANSGTQFECMVTNVSGSVTSSAASLTVTASSTPLAVAITSPANGNIFAPGSAITMTASASIASGSITKVVFYNGSTVLATDTTSPYTYTWNNVAPGTYSLTAVAYSGGVSTTTTTGGGWWSSSIITTLTKTTPVVSTTSAAVTVTVNNPPTVNLVTDNNTYTAPATINFTATASEINGTIAQVQFYNGSTLLGTDTTSPYNYSWTNVPAGNYTLTAKAIDANGVSTKSSSIAVTVAPTPVAPSFTAQPADTTVYAAAAATFSVSASGTPAPAFQWMQSINGGAFTAINGATKSSYTIAATTLAQSGAQYECVITNVLGSRISNAATLTVNPAPIIAPAIISQPASISINPFAPATFSVSASGTAGTYQWMVSVDGGAFTAISGATSSSLTVSNTSASESGTQYEVVVTNAAGDVVSAPATLTVSSSLWW